MTESLGNIEEGFNGKNKSVLDAFPPGAVFSTVYSPITRQFLAFPSGDTSLLNGLAPQNLVPRRSGHAIVNRQFSQVTGTEPTNNVGLTMFLEQDGSISVEWRSASVNGLNPSFPGDLVPESLRPQIVEDISKALDREVWSR